MPHEKHLVNSYHHDNLFLIKHIELDRVAQGGRAAHRYDVFLTDQDGGEGKFVHSFDSLPDAILTTRKIWQDKGVEALLNPAATETEQADDS